MAKPPFPAAPTREFMRERLRELAADASNFVFDHPHFQERLRARGLSLRHAIECLRAGEIVDGPTLDNYGAWRVKVLARVAGRRVQVVVAYKGDHFDAITII
jgi:uncharacterized DUF497 family protein